MRMGCLERLPQTKRGMRDTEAQRARCVLREFLESGTAKSNTPVHAARSEKAWIAEPLKWLWIAIVVCNTHRASARVFCDLASGWVSAGRNFVEMDDLLDAVSTGPRRLELADAAGLGCR